MRYILAGGRCAKEAGRWEVAGRNWRLGLASETCRACLFGASVYSPAWRLRPDDRRTRDEMHMVWRECFSKKALLHVPFEGPSLELVVKSLTSLSLLR